LTNAKTDLFQQKLSFQNFIKNCHKSIEIAQNSELKYHRGFWGNLWHAIKVALNIITFGAVAVTPTKSIVKTINIHKTFNSLVDSNDDNKNNSEPLKSSV